MQLLERLQYHLYKIQESQYFWDSNETGGKLEVVFDPSPKELQDFLKDYPVCKAVSDGYGHWIFAFGQKICHDTLDIILDNWARKNNIKIKTPKYMDDHLSITKSGLILGSREANSFEQTLSAFMDFGIEDEEVLTPKERLAKYKKDIKQMLTAINQLKSKYSWLKISPALAEEISIALKGETFKDNGTAPYYRW